MRSFFVVVTGLMALAAAETVSTVMYFGGGLPQCSSCGAPRQYACSNGIGAWNLGQVSFQDPIPWGRTLLAANFSVYGSFACMGQSSTLRLSLNGIVVDVLPNPQTGNLCKCGSCDGALNYTNHWEGGAPSYNYGHMNVVQLTPVGDAVCISRVEATFLYGDLKPGYAYSSYQFNDTGIMSSYCAEYGHFVYIAHAGVYDLTFHDFLPRGAVLLSVYVELFGAYFCDESGGTQTSDQVRILLNTIRVDQKNLIGPGGCGTVTCNGGVQFGDGTVYQFGWPKYSYGGDNVLEISPTNDSAYLGRVDVALSYYIPTADNAKEVLQAKLRMATSVA